VICENGPGDVGAAVVGPDTGACVGGMDCATGRVGAAVVDADGVPVGLAVGAQPDPLSLPPLPPLSLPDSQPEPST
jgi:hypothetical protein